MNSKHPYDVVRSDGSGVPVPWGDCPVDGITNCPLASYGARKEGIYCHHPGADNLACKLSTCPLFKGPLLIRMRTRGEHYEEVKPT